jgi:L-lactate dehydrogenase complex protein LldG
MSILAREVILTSVRHAIDPRSDRPEQEYSAIRRDYEVKGSQDRESRTAMFLHRLQEYGAGVHQCGKANVAEQVKRCLLQREKGTVIVPAGIEPNWVPAGFRFVTDEALDDNALDKSDGVLTGCALAIASTGSLVIRLGPSQGRRALTLLPDYHLCVVAHAQIVETVPEAIRILDADGTTSATIISGPSATSDIEMMRIQGVHGPRTLDVIVFE